MKKLLTKEKKKLSVIDLNTNNKIVALIKI